MARFARYWLPALLWMAMVLYASSDTFSAENTGSVLEAVLTAIFGPVQPHIFDLIHAFIRKSAHFTEYGILGLLWFRAWRGARAGHRWSWAFGAIGIALATAITDEVHQGFVPSRTGSARDVLLDLVGAVTLQVALWAVITRRTNAGSFDSGIRPRSR